MIDDPHGYIAGFKRLIWPVLYVFIAVVILIAVLWPNEGAH